MLDIIIDAEWRAKVDCRVLNPELVRSIAIVEEFTKDVYLISILNNVYLIWEEGTDGKERGIRTFLPAREAEAMTYNE